MVPNKVLHILTIHFEPLKRGQPLYTGQYAWSQGVLYNGGSTVLLLIVESSLVCVVVVSCLSLFFLFQTDS